MDEEPTFHLHAHLEAPLPLMLIVAVVVLGAVLFLAGALLG
jgi:hypothetical protein